MADTRIGDIFFSAEGDRGCAYWRGVADTGDTFLCAVDLAAYNAQAEVRDQFMALASAVAAHRQRAFIAGMGKPISRLAGLPCETCEAPQANDVRHRAAQVADINELELSPSGLPMGCCRVRTVGVMGGNPDTSRPTAR
jgi:hypothetical protein